MSEQPLLELKNINKFYPLGQERLQVLFDINLTVNKGEFIAVRGPSGSGKSTLMNILGCMDTADGGEYFLAGEAVHQATDSQMTKLRNLHMNAWCFMQMNYPVRFKARLYMKRFALCRRRSGRCCFSDFGAALEMKRSHVGCR